MTTYDDELLVGLVDLNRQARQEAMDRGISVEFLLAASLIDLIEASNLDHDRKLVAVYVEDWKRSNDDANEQLKRLLLKKKP